MDPAPTKPEPSPLSRQSAQVALAVFFAVLLGLLAFRGYGNRLDARPTDHVSGTTRIDLNTADRTELSQIPGVGPERAKAIEEYRTTKGRFRSVDDLQEVNGFGEKTVEKVRPFVRVEPVSGSPIELEPAVGRPSPQSPSPSPRPSPRSASVQKLQPGDPPINVNTASLEELQRLPDVGPVTAQNIAAARPFRSVDDLDRVKGIGPKRLEKIRPFVVVK